ncbi:murein L,D-transpeptidase catalytic domain family protein [Parasegetibacter sp. NRK P23]|uniref:murein L,D-transpeptidase catalytic domain family protein n=1 Tax=Parasegetibacter sp. NRK P23 TaxID=2942999 RepID=UPI002043E9E5|nr:murein L,D-transpeptidase catalytic domain family protein [Parasegetibacter sp. NRK P23]
MIRSFLNPALLTGTIMVAGIFGPVFSSVHRSFSSDKTSYTDSIRRNPAELMMPADANVSAAAVLFDSLKLEERGMNEEVFEYAFNGHRKLVEKGLVRNDEILSICDFSQSSRKKRLYVINLETKEVLINTYVAHGRNSGSEFANSFSNKPESHKSSLGFYVTDRTYSGEHGLALKIRGLEKGFNDNAWNRAIVIHGSDYVNEQFIRANKFMGRSFGCPAVSFKDHKNVINTIKGGSCLFIYHPSKNYLQQSKIINT